MSESATYRVSSSMRCSVVSIGKVDRLGERSILTEVYRTGVGWERDTVEEISQKAAVVCVRSTGGLIGLLHSWIGLPGCEIQLIVQ